MTTLDSQRGDVPAVGDVAAPGDVAVVVVAGGAGVRLGAGPPKALRALRGEPLLQHALHRLAAAGSVGCVVVVAPAGHEPAVRELLRPDPLAPAPAAGGPAERAPGRTLVVTGGRRRQQSVAAGLAAVPAGFDIVLVHDAARPLAPSSLVEEVAAAIRAGHDAVIPVLPVTDTITRIGPGGEVVDTPDRSVLRAVQTPQGFRRAVLAAAHAAATGVSATDDAGLVARLGVPVHTVPGSPCALKITNGYDLRAAEALLDGPDPPRADR